MSPSHGASMDLFGHDQLWQQWHDAMASSRMHHGWILAGREGIGKACFAIKAARALLTEPGIPQPPGDQHPDLLVITPLPSSDDEEKKREEGKPFQVKRNISIDQIRFMQRRLTTRPTLGSRRVVIIDCADILEKAASNALLKALEEPPAGTFFLLISHRPGRLLPTIRSRCRMLRFSPLDTQTIARIVRGILPEAAEAQVQSAAEAADGSVGAALRIIEYNLTVIHGIMRQIIREGDPSLAHRSALTLAVGARPERDRQLAMVEMAQTLLGQHLAPSDRGAQQRIIAAHARLTSIYGQVPTHNFDPALLTVEIGSLLASVSASREAGQWQTLST